MKMLIGEFRSLTVSVLVGVLFFASVASFADTASKSKTVKKKLPVFIDLGADKCMACKAMTPVLKEIKKELKGQLDVQFIDVWKDRSAGMKYKIRMIPTQIFFSAENKELWRHVGFISKKDILKELKKLGYEFKIKSEDKK